MQGLPKVLLRTQGHGHGVHEAGLPGVGYHRLHGYDQPEGRVEHENPQEIWGNPENGVVP